MLPLRERAATCAASVDGLRHVSWFLSPPIRDAFHDGGCDLVPNNFSDVPHLMRSATRCSLVLAAVSPPDAHGYFSLGCHAEYVAAMIGEMPFFVEANAQMPRTFGENQVHVRDVLGWCEADYPLIEVAAPSGPPRSTGGSPSSWPSGSRTARRCRSASGRCPEQVLALLGDHRDLGVHTELIGEGVRRPDRVRRHHRPPQGAPTRNKIDHHHRARHEAAVRLRRREPRHRALAGRATRTTRATSAASRMMTPINADARGRLPRPVRRPSRWAATTGRPPAARPTSPAARCSPRTGSRSSSCTPRPHDESVSRIVPQLRPGAAVTTFKNVVDTVVTEHGRRRAARAARSASARAG